VNLLNKVGVKHIRAHKNYLRLYREDKTSELMGFKCVNALPDIARHEYLRFLLNDSNYTVYMSTKHLDRGTTQNILYSLQNAVSRTMSTRWYKKHASDIQRTEISKVDQQIKFVSDQIGNETHVYDLKEICIYVLFKGITRKEIKKKMDEFEEKMTNYNRGFVVNDLNYFQIDAFTNTRCYELPSLQFRKSY
jgi:hypothetical protein